MKYNVSVNGKRYEVEIERAEAGHTTEKPDKSDNRTAPSAESEIVRSPMPGTIVDVKVSAGQQVEKGQTLLILEAMKMENEIVAARDGVVGSVSVAKGATVNANDVLLALK